MYLLFKTVFDIGLKRILLRLRYEFRKIIDKLIGHKISIFICKIGKCKPKWKRFINTSKKSLNKDFLQGNSQNYVDFNFLNDKKRIYFPLTWNNKDWPRLWQFHLHYFNFVKYELDLYLDKGKFKDQNILKVIDDWIRNNPPSLGDGWHSYTTSLRIRNWTWFFIFFPEFLNKKRINSLWDQILWLDSHPEECHGGNHWIENLSSLIFGALQFESKTSDKLFLKSLRKLKDELDKQILQDGGHEERSASYHILILERLVELGFFIQIHKYSRPVWLASAISKMSTWLEKVILENGSVPRFNDSSIDFCELPEDILLFAKSYLNQKNFGLTGRKKFLISLINKDKNKANIEFVRKKSEDLPNTGWTILRPGDGWELVFKNGVPCPNHLPAHVHSDLLSFDLFRNGIPIIAETGTSTYENNRFRKYERSGMAHNLVQLASSKERSKLNNKGWIEPIEVWGNFRAARKAKPLSRELKILPNDILLVSGSHDGFSKSNINHKRTIKVKVDNEKCLNMEFVENIYCANYLKICIWFHLGPDINYLFLNKAFIKLVKEFGFVRNDHETYYAEGFGKTIPRKSISLEGILNPGNHEIRYDFNIS